MKYSLIVLAIIIVAAGVLLFYPRHSQAPTLEQPAVQQEQQQTAATGTVLVTWRQPQACPQYGGTKQCYVAEGAYGGYANWAATRATFIWKVNPCPDGKKVVRIDSASCVYETNGAVGAATTTLDRGSAVVDCRHFAAQYKDDACTCNNGITLNARLECQ
ncbi:MAG: hypothetical protein KGI70_02690 [Patescibacteria group bacterium]|nr:hypothetical protein [Patescibacteria group bacterium]